MRAVLPQTEDRALARIAGALAAHAPTCGCEVAPCGLGLRHQAPGADLEGEADGDLVVLFVNGRRDHFLGVAGRCRARGQRYAVVQVALRTTAHKRTDRWRELWRHAALVWSYLPLPAWISEEGGAPLDFPFYHSPLGADPGTFTPPADAAQPRPYSLCTFGLGLDHESLAEIDDAVLAVDGRLLRLGARQAVLHCRHDVADDVADADLARLYRRCQFVSGLRRGEGFELPAAEGLLCGTRPLLYDQRHFRDWYGSLAEYVPEMDRAGVCASLVRLLQVGPRPVTPAERQAAACTFDWASVAGGFWGRLQ